MTFSLFEVCFFVTWMVSNIAIVVIGIWLVAKKIEDKDIQKHMAENPPVPVPMSNIFSDIKHFSKNNKN